MLKKCQHYLSGPSHTLSTNIYPEQPSLEIIEELSLNEQHFQIHNNKYYPRTQLPMGTGNGPIILCKPELETQLTKLKTHTWKR